MVCVCVCVFERENVRQFNGHTGGINEKEVVGGDKEGTT